MLSNIIGGDRPQAWIAEKATALGAHVGLPLLLAMFSAWDCHRGHHESEGFLATRKKLIGEEEPLSEDIAHHV